MIRGNLLLSFQKSVRRLGHHQCLKYKESGRWKALSWIQAEALVRDLALGLVSLGVKKGQSVAILSKTRYEWTLCDLAILSLGAVTVPIYPSTTAEQAAYILENSDARVVFAEDEDQVRKIKAVQKGLKKLETIVVIEGRGTGDVLSLAALNERGWSGNEAAWLKNARDIVPTDTATIVYTSGTTGPPKGAVLTHGNFLSEVDALTKAFDMSGRDVGLLFLPLSHIFARGMQFWQLGDGFIHAYAGGMETLLEDMAQIRPQFLTSVPRLFEKIHETVQGQLQALPPLKRAFLSTVGDFLVRRKVRQLFGGRLRRSICGGAPISQEILEYFNRAGVLVLEGYGLTETTAGVFINTEAECRFGTVGKGLHGVQAKIAKDGEILIRAPMIFQGYYKDPKATAAALSRDGWFKTGDIGTIDQDGYLKITDRKKDIIITAAGKNIAPQNIERLLKTVPYISQVMVHGDRRKYLTALVTLNRQAVERYASRRGLRTNGAGSLSSHPAIHRLISECIAAKNRALASYETIKRFAILEEEFTQERGELTPTLKLKRKYVVEKYKDMIEGLYED